VYTAGLRIPFYSLGDSIDLIAAKSTVSIPASVITPGGTLALNGKGNIFAVRWNHLLPREGEYTSRLVFGLDWKDLENPCKGLVNAGCIGILETPVSATYVGQWQKPNVAADFNVGIAYNLLLRERQAGWRYNYAANARSTQKDFVIFRTGGSYLRSLPGDWQARGAITAQYSENPLPTTEQLGLTGAQAVRGINERTLTSDSGFVANIEGYTPDLIPLLASTMHLTLPGSLRLLAFYDTAYGWSRPMDGSVWFDPHVSLIIPAGTKAINERTTVESVGLGLRYSLRKDVSARFDWARILQSSPGTRLTPLVPVDDQWRAHFSVVYGF
jgi:hemolysin activation/secretion protein